MLGLRQANKVAKVWNKARFLATTPEALRTTKLENGVHVHSVGPSDKGQVHVSLVVDAGSRVEDFTIAGMAQQMAHLGYMVNFALMCRTITKLALSAFKEHSRSSELLMRQAIPVTG